MKVCSLGALRYDKSPSFATKFCHACYLFFCQFYRPKLATGQTQNRGTSSTDGICMQTHYYRVGCAESCHQVGNVARHSVLYKNNSHLASPQIRGLPGKGASTED